MIDWSIWFYRVYEEWQAIDIPIWYKDVGLWRLVPIFMTDGEGGSVQLPLFLLM